MTAEAPAQALTGFRSESEMLQDFVSAASSKFVAGAATWILVQEHEVTDRIADLMLARVDVPALEARLATWERPLTLSEVRILRCLRLGSGATPAAVGRRVRITPERARQLLLGLERQGLVARTKAGAFRRKGRLQPAVRGVTTFELKRQDWRGALVQARAHQAFADRAYVVFDAIASAFSRNLARYEVLGIGLLSFCAATRAIEERAPSRTSDLRDNTLAILNSERVLARLLGFTATRLPQASLPSAAAGSGHRVPPTILGPGSRRLEHLLSAAALPRVAACRSAR